MACVYGVCVWHVHMVCVWRVYVYVCTGRKGEVQRPAAMSQPLSPLSLNLPIHQRPTSRSKSSLASRQDPQRGPHSLPPHLQGKHLTPTVGQTDIQTGRGSILFGSALRKTQNPGPWVTASWAKCLKCSALLHRPLPKLQASCSDNRTFKIHPYSLLKEK